MLNSEEAVTYLLKINGKRKIVVNQRAEKKEPAIDIRWCRCFVSCTIHFYVEMETITETSFMEAESI